MTRFLQNAHHAELAAHLTHWLEHCAGTAYQPYALIDMSQLDDTARRGLMRASWTSTAMLDGSRYAAYDELGPRLFPLANADAVCVARLLSVTDRRPALSVIELPVRNGSAELGTLHWLADAQTADGTRLYCRFTDTRILPEVLGILDPAQKTRLARAARRWAWVARDGTLQTTNIAPADTAEPSDDETSIHFNDAQFAALMQATEADTLFDILNDNAPKTIPTAEPAELWHRLNVLLGIARTHGITDAPDQGQFIFLAWHVSEHFHTLPALAPSFDAIRRGTLRFPDAVAHWDSDIWNQLEAMADRPGIAPAAEPQ
ncbi:MAG TPA: DUF4123 domain-containing protein [Denitromonas sp.]|nr:DUF4123 domain-containing protein [Zoogloeaceae bacterium]HPR08199.1 DUF4123 domain-containing protein [Denitromonas sp.]HQU89183.1 DUF4123 domain-containing protein [Denitromonas sp.]HQV15336.1 DUF4123 domain-containing protein [Denitromonas sp.]